MRPSTHASRTAPAGIVREVDVAEGLSAIDAPRPGIEAFVLVRVFTEPIGLLRLTLDSGRLEPQELAGAITAELGSRLRPRLERSGLSWSGTIPLDGLQP